MNWMIYGATGYTGQLIIEEAIKRGERPVLAGRTRDKLIPLQKKHDLEIRDFALNHIGNGLKGISAVLHCAGPFSQTSKPMLDACLASGAHYLDITGEIDVFEAIFQRKKDAQDSQCIVIPGVGFDVVPSDCLAGLLKKKLPDANELELGFYGWGKLSPGTTKTIIENLSKGGRVRRNGKIFDIPALSLSCQAKFPDKMRTLHVAAWGDVSTAYHSTGIPNITVYAKAPEWLVRSRSLLEPLARITEWGPFRKKINQLVEKHVKGPTPEEQKTSKVFLWGRVKNEKGESREGTLEVCEAYRLTALTAVSSVQGVLKLKIPGGCYTPSLAFSPEFISTFPEANLQL